MVQTYLAQLMPSFLITDILSHDQQQQQQQQQQQITYPTGHEPRGTVPDTSFTSNNKFFMTLQQYLTQSPGLVTLLPLLWQNALSGGTGTVSNDNDHTQQKGFSEKNRQLVEVLLQQTELLMRGEELCLDRSQSNPVDKALWRVMSSTNHGAFHPVRRGSEGNGLHGSPVNRVTLVQNDSVEHPNDETKSSEVRGSASLVDSVDDGLGQQINSKNKTTSRKLPPTASFMAGTDGLDLGGRLDDSSQGSGDDLSFVGGKSQYGSNSALDALIHMTTSSMQRLNHKLDKPITAIDRMDINAFGRGTPMAKRRKTRTTFSNSQLSELENNFNRQKYLTPTDRDRIAKHLGLSNTQVITWFQNRRAKLKREAEELERDILAARQQEQQKLLETRSEASEDSVILGHNHLEQSGDITLNARPEVNESRRTILNTAKEFLGSSPDRPTYPYSNSAAIFHRPAISEGDGVDNSNNNNNDNDIPKTAQTINTIFQKKKHVWSPAEEAEECKTG